MRVTVSTTYEKMILNLNRKTEDADRLATYDRFRQTDFDTSGRPPGLVSSNGLETRSQRA